MLINKIPMLDMVIRRIEDAPEVVLDVETSGLDYLKNHIVGWVVTVGPTPNDTFYIPVRHAGGGNMPAIIQIPTTSENWNREDIHPAEFRLIKAIKNKPLVFHHASFDMAFMSQVGWEPSGPIADTMIAAYLLDELRTSLSLEACCKEEKVAAKLSSIMYQHLAEKLGCAPDKSSMSHFWRLPGDDAVAVNYASGDGTSTYQLWQEYKRRIATPYFVNATREFDLKRVAAVEFALIPVLHKMRMRGVKVNEERLTHLINTLEADFKKSQKLIGDLNPRSPLQMRAYFEKHNITSWPKTLKGAPSFPELWLKTTEPGRAVLVARKYRTILDTFLLPMRGRHMRNGRVHTNFHQTRDELFGTKTGRLSTTDPNLGAQPGKRQKEMGALFRSVYEADEGMEFCEADYRAMEIRICAHYCKAKAWVDGFWKGLDPHTAVAQDIGIERPQAKVINLGIMMGMGKGRVAQELNMPMGEANATVDRYFAGLPELAQFQQQSANVFRSRGFVSTLLGRRLQLANPNKAFTAVNRLTQGGNADCMKSAMVALDKHDDISMSLTVYDSCLFQVEKGNVAARERAIQKMVDMPAIGIPEFSIPMEAEYGQGKTWADATFTVLGHERWEPAQ